MIALSSVIMAIPRTQEPLVKRRAPQAVTFESFVVDWSWRTVVTVVLLVAAAVRAAASLISW